jgi:hypothetical protein
VPILDMLSPAVSSAIWAAQAAVHSPLPRDYRLYTGSYYFNSSVYVNNSASPAVLEGVIFGARLNFTEVQHEHSTSAALSHPFTTASSQY